MNKKQNSGLEGFSVFGKQPSDSIQIPKMPYAIRNDCKLGAWKSGTEQLGKKMALSIGACLSFWGDLGETTDEEWWQLWFIAEREGTEIKVPFNTVMVTYLKKESLGNLNNEVTLIMQEEEPAMKVWLPTFEPRANKYGTFYALTWQCRERTEKDTPIELIANVFTSRASELVDSHGTKKMQPGRRPTEAQRKEAAQLEGTEEKKALESAK